MIDLNTTIPIFTASIIASILITAFVVVYLIDNDEFEGLGISVGPTNTFHYPQDVKVNSTGFIYVADTFNNRIQIFDSSGVFSSTFGTPGDGTADATLYQPNGLALNGTNVFVTDTLANFIKIFNHGGSFNATIGTPGTGTDEYYRPSGIDTNSSHAFIADTFNNRIVIIDLGTGLTVDTIP